MDFFEHQYRARRNTTLLVFYFLLAVFLIILAVNAVVFFVFSYGEDLAVSFHSWMDNTYWEHPTAAVVLVIFFASANRFLSLMGGGEALAKMAGGRLLDLQTSHPDEKKYIHVVEEMAIASGVPMPQLYIMDREQGINAFVAGYQPTEAVMVVTKGALDALTRDELQGVVGHEFSHILNGDMRLNVRLIAILAGILALGQIGYYFLRGGFSRSRNHYGDREGGARSAFLVIGLALVAIGYIGLFFGRLIKAAISRQREFLADASAVQFTRNPAGIAGALFKIKESTQGAHLNSRYAEDMSHMCFGETLHVSMGRLLATHPPLDERIALLDPVFLTSRRAQQIVAQQQVAVPEPFTGFDGRHGFAASATGLAQSIGQPDSDHLIYAQGLYKQFSAELLTQVHDSTTAKGIVYALILGGMSKQAGLLFLQRAGEQVLMDSLGRQLDVILQLERRLRLPLIELLLPVLKRLDQPGRQQFLKTVDALVVHDNNYSLFEFVLVCLLQQHLAVQAVRADKIKYHSFRPVLDDIQLILSVMIQASGQADEKKQACYLKNIKTFSQQHVSLMPLKQVRAVQLTASLNRLNQLSPLLKKSLVTACADAVIDDGIIMPAEVELLRAITACLDCPMPPVIIY